MPRTSTRHAYARVLKRLRKDTRVSAEDLAERIGIHFNSVYRYERGETVPDVEYIADFEEVLGLPYGAVWESVKEQPEFSASVPPEGPLSGETVSGDEYEALESLSGGEPDPVELMRARYAEKAYGLRQALGVKGGGANVVDLIYGFGRAHPSGADKVAARWIGTVFRVGFERRDDERLRQAFGEYFCRPEELSEQDVYLTVSALLTALSVMARRFESTVEDWPKEPGEEPDVTS